MIAIKCPDCGKVINIRAVKLEREIAQLKAKIRELEAKDGQNMFNQLFGGGR
jgi:transcription initiation factor IIE alpha subunit